MNIIDFGIEYKLNPKAVKEAERTSRSLYPIAPKAEDSQAGIHRVDKTVICNDNYYN